MLNLTAHVLTPYRIGTRERNAQGVYVQVLTPHRIGTRRFR